MGKSRFKWTAIVSGGAPFLAPAEITTSHPTASIRLSQPSHSKEVFPIKGCKGFLALILALLLPLTALAEYPIILLEPELASMAVEAVQVLGVELPPDAVFCKIPYH